jgi:UDP-sugar transporter A1/2/3
VQLKILTTALFSVLILKKQLSLGQWKALFLLVLGVITIQGLSADSTDGNSNNVVGV